MIKRFSELMLIAIAIFTLSGCIYRLDVPQGNYLEEEKIAELKYNMTREQVQFILGTPITIDPFNKNRWNYIFLIQEGWEDPVQKNLFVIFDNNRLVEINGDYSLEALQSKFQDQTSLETKPQE